MNSNAKTDSTPKTTDTQAPDSPKADSPKAAPAKPVTSQHTKPRDASKRKEWKKERAIALGVMQPGDDVQIP